MPSPLVDDAETKQLGLGNDATDDTLRSCTGSGDDTGDMGSMSLPIVIDCAGKNRCTQNPVRQIRMLAVDTAVENSDDFVLAGPGLKAGRIQLVDADEASAVFATKLGWLKNAERLHFGTLGKR